MSMGDRTYGGVVGQFKVLSMARGGHVGDVTRNCAFSPRHPRIGWCREQPRGSHEPRAIDWFSYMATFRWGSFQKKTHCFPQGRHIFHGQYCRFLILYVFGFKLRRSCMVKIEMYRSWIRSKLLIKLHFNMFNTISTLFTGKCGEMWEPLASS